MENEIHEKIDLFIDNIVNYIKTHCISNDLSTREIIASTLYFLLVDADKTNRLRLTLMEVITHYNNNE